MITDPEDYESEYSEQLGAVIDSLQNIDCNTAENWDGDRRMVLLQSDINELTMEIRSLKKVMLHMWNKNNPLT